MTAPTAPARRVTGRYAPSPTGPLHLGNLRTALAAWLAARAEGGRFLLRIEDNDLDRNRPGAEARMLEDLRWLGLDWDEPPLRQSERRDAYHELLARLARAGRVYACACSRRDLADAGAPHGPAGVVYPGTCRGRVVAPDALPASRAPGAPAEAPRAVAFRVALDATRVVFVDRLRGAQEAGPGDDAGDPVVLRRDGLWAYHFACAIDDGLTGVTQVVRGEDLLTATVTQIALQRASGLAAPAEWLHLPLMTDERGARLSKRDGAASLDAWRAGGMPPAGARAQLAASLGAWPDGGAPASLDDLIVAWRAWLAERGAAPPAADVTRS